MFLFSRTFPCFFLFPIDHVSTNHRLGHGKGHYDKYFTKYKELSQQKQGVKFPYLIGIGVEANYCENVPIEDHDWVLNKTVLYKESEDLNKNTNDI